jgi:hypothetical protein
MSAISLKDIQAVRRLGIPKGDTQASAALLVAEDAIHRRHIALMAGRVHEAMCWDEEALENYAIATQGREIVR